MKNTKIHSVVSTGLMLGSMLLIAVFPLPSVYADASESVTTLSYIDGQMASEQLAHSASFPMTAVWDSRNVGIGGGSYDLGSSNPVPYQAMSADLSPAASYSTNEVTDTAVVGADCSANSQFALVGYTTGDTLAEAAAATPTATIPAFKKLTHDAFVIVWNKTCTSSDGTSSSGSDSGTIGGTVTEGVSPAVLAITSIDAVQTTATADGTFANGWKYIFHITVPENEPELSMKFGDWKDSTNTYSIPVAGNMRISSLQANNSATILLAAADAYSSPALTMTGDLDATAPGKQVEVAVEVAVPSTSVNGTYTTAYGVQTVP